MRRVGAAIANVRFEQDFGGKLPCPVRRLLVVSCRFLRVACPLEARLIVEGQPGRLEDLFQQSLGSGGACPVGQWGGAFPYT